jgi:uncharacterized protein YbaR (Trm112 family)
VYILLTDHLRCPRCGPEHGLVLLGERIEARRVLEGVLGCPNCRERYPVRGGWADLRGPVARSTGAEGREAAAVPASHQPAGVEVGPRAGAGRGVGADLQESVLRLAAQLGVREGPAFVLVSGVAIELAAGVAGLVPGLEVVTVGAGLEGLGEVPGVSRLAVGAGLPLAAGSMRAVALAGDGAIALEEAARVVGPFGRLVLRDADPTALERLARLGFQVLAQDGAEVVAVRR